MHCYIDDFNLVRIESNDYIDSVYLLGEKLNFIKSENGNQYFKTNKEIPLHFADKIYINNNEYNLSIGLVTLKKRFEELYRYDGKLGALYAPSKTTFKVFSPVAKEMYVSVDGTSYKMNYKQPVWEVDVFGNLENKKYYYYVRINDKFEQVSDPYALSGDIKESIVINIANTYQMKEDFITFKRIEDAVIYEGHIRDLTYNLDVKDKCNYLGLTEKSELLKSSVIEYVKGLGISHLQLLPVQDFIGVNQYDKEESYNWGYNPQSYFTLSGWFSNNPSDGASRINEFKQMVDYAHQHKLGINVDVVYNHVYERGMYPYDKLVPGYFYRHDKDYKPSDSAGVGNDVETTNYMVRKLIVDSMSYLTETFKIDGYRFDLMGLMDIETMLMIEEKLKLINPNIMLYGEGWNMHNPLPNEIRSHMFNNELMPYYGHFNDKFRNVIKGNQHDMTLGFGSGSNKELKFVKEVILGTKSLFKNNHQTINYIECHDNYTFYDQMMLSGVKTEHLKYYQDFANHLIAISEGVAFYHAGQEMYRAKQLVENSYKSNDEINSLKWELHHNLDKFKEVLKIRKEFINKKQADIKITKKDNLLVYKIKLKLKAITIYIKNDFRENNIKELNKLIFSSQDLVVNNNEYNLDKPGIYIYLDN